MGSIGFGTQRSAPAASAFSSTALRQVRAGDDDADVLRLGLQLEAAADLDSVELGHVDVEHDEVGLEAADHHQRVDAVLRQLHLHARAVRLEPPLERAQRDERRRRR